MSVLCGSGDGCNVRLPRRGLCARHKAKIQAAWAKVNVGPGSRNGILRTEPMPPRPPRLTRAEQAAALGRLVAGRVEPLDAEDAAAALGVSKRTLGRIVAEASAAGLVDARPGRRGLMPGDHDATHRLQATASTNAAAA